MHDRAAVDHARRLDVRMSADVERPVLIARFQVNRVQDAFEIASVDNAFGDGDWREERRLGIVNPAAVTIFKTKCPHLAVSRAYDGDAVSYRGTADDTAGDVLLPLLLAVLKIKSGDHALGAFERAGRVTDAAAGDNDGFPFNGSSSPRIELERRSPKDVAGIGVETIKRSIADFLFVEKCRGDQILAVNNRHRCVNVPF